MFTEKNTGSEPASLWSDMVQSSFTFWQGVLQEMSEAGKAGSTGEDAEKEAPWSGAAKAAMESARLAADPAGQFGAAPGVSMQMFQLWNEQFQQMLGEGMEATASFAGSAGRKQPADVFQASAEAYSRSIRRLLGFPKLGLHRYYQERMAHMMDQFSLFTIKSSEFSALLLQPVGKSFAKMGERLGDMSENGGFPTHVKDYYGIWVKTLEAEYAGLLNSPHFVKAFHGVLNQYLELYSAWEEVLQDGLQFLPVAVKRDMEPMYRENHQLKQQMRAMTRRTETLEKSVKELEAGMEALNERIESLTAGSRQQQAR